MAKKRASARSATDTRNSITRRRTRTAPEPDPNIFPSSVILVWADGTEEELPFADPVESAKGNLNAWAGNKFVHQGKILRVNCNVTQVKN